MMKTHIALFTIISTLTTVSTGPTAHAQEVNKSVAFKTADGKYITTAANSAVNLSGTKVGTKQIFTLTDVNGGELADGDEIKIGYVPTPKAGEPAKPNYWREAKDGMKRGADAGVFKLKKVGEKYAFQAPSGKFVGLPGETPAALPLVDEAEKALTVEIVPVATTNAIAPDAAKTSPTP